jgi:hypothetical protein
MKAVFRDLQWKDNPANSKVIESPESALQLLDSLLDRPPSLCTLSSEDAKAEILVGVGDPLGCVQFSASDGAPPYLMPRADSVLSGNDYVTFLAGGTPTEIPRRYCLPWPQVREIVDYFIKHGSRKPDLIWEEI